MNFIRLKTKFSKRLMNQLNDHDKKGIILTKFVPTDIATQRLLNAQYYSREAIEFREKSAYNERWQIHIKENEK